MNRAAGVAGTVLGVAYPLLAYSALRQRSPREVALLGLALAVPVLGLRGWAIRGTGWGWPLALGAGTLAALAGGALFADQRWILLQPTLISLALLFGFGGSLFTCQSAVERFARLQDGRLSPEEVTHCRQATSAWCVFFFVNAGIAATLALRGYREAWAIYTGGISYCLIGALFLAEYLLRRWRFPPSGRARTPNPAEPEPKRELAIRRQLSAVSPPRPTGPDSK